MSDLATMLSFAASDAACYKWPEDTEIHRACRAAFCEGAASNATAFESNAKVIAALKGAFLAHLMRENECYCFRHGVPCDEKKCGCLMELQAAVDEQDNERELHGASMSEATDEQTAGET